MVKESPKNKRGRVSLFTDSSYTAEETEESFSKEISTMRLRSKRRVEFQPRERKSKPSVETASDTVRPETPIEFTSCLSRNEFDVRSPSNNMGSTTLTSILKKAVSVDGELSDKSWLSSNVIDLVFARFAKIYQNVEYLSNDFIMLALNNNDNNFEGVTDILGQRLQYNHSRPMVLLYNSNSIHWTLFRIQYQPEPTIQLFEPMGKPHGRSGRLSYRDVPRDVVRWLDTCCPLPKNDSWLSVSCSAITKQQQVTSFDCGVACLLYAEKCGLGHDKEDINDLTSQEHITEYRKTLQEYLSKLHHN